MRQLASQLIRIPDCNRSELAKQVGRILAEAGPMQLKEIKRKICAPGSQSVLQAAINEALRYDLRGDVIRRGKTWGLLGDLRFISF